MALPAVEDFDPGRDYFLGDRQARVTLIQYSDYTCPHCRHARDVLARTADRLAGQAVFIDRQAPSKERLPESERGSRAALAAGLQHQFWAMHSALFDRGQRFSTTALRARAFELGLDANRFEQDLNAEPVTARLNEDRRTAEAAGAVVTPTLFIGGRRYDGAWDELSIIEAVERPLGVRLKIASQDFFDWAASAGLVLVIATLLALVVANIGFHDAYESFRLTDFGFLFGTNNFALPVRTWVNDGLMAVFFLLVGIEIKRELVDGELSDPARAATPLIGAIGGMVVPALIYAALNISGASPQGWGVPMATDIAFTLGLMALLGRRVPISLKVFVSALAVADDLGAILVIAVFYGHGFHLSPLIGALAMLVVMFTLNRGRVYARAPYLILGVVLWVLVYESGVHATLAGVLTAAMIPSRRSGSIAGVAAQTSAIFEAEMKNAADSEQAAQPIRPASLEILQTAMDRLREPGYHLEKALEGWTNFLILPLFAFFNMGIVVFGSSFAPTAPPNLGVMLGLVVGKPLGIVGACWIAMRLGIARPSSEISWTQMIGAGCLAGIGFTMSIFIATSAFDGDQLGAVKLSVLLASTLSTVLGMTILYVAGDTNEATRRRRPPLSWHVRSTDR